MSLFEFQKIGQSDPRFRDLLALRYKVYCEERGFESPQDHPDGLERDEYDNHSVHFAAIMKQTQKIMGTIRLILHSEKGFPIEQSFEFNKSLPQLHKEQLTEVSRLALSWQYCRELEGRLRLGPEANEVVTGLVRCIIQEAFDREITHFYAVMARGLPILLARRKIIFSQIGPAKEYHGLRAPYIWKVQDVFNQNQPLRPTANKTQLIKVA